MRDAGRWSALLPFNGHLRVLANPATGADGDLFLTNLINTPAAGSPGSPPSRYATPGPRATPADARATSTSRP
jgi:hypothetical protein